MELQHISKTSQFTVNALNCLLLYKLRSKSNSGGFSSFDRDIFLCPLLGCYTGSESSSSCVLLLQSGHFLQIDGDNCSLTLGVLTGNNGWVCWEHIPPAVQHKTVSVSMIAATLIESFSFSSPFSFIKEQSCERADFT